MAEFINTSEGFLNLAHILWVKFGAGGEEGFDLLQMSDGRLLKCQVQDPLFKLSLRNRAPEFEHPGFIDDEDPGSVRTTDTPVRPSLQVPDPDPQKS